MRDAVIARSRLSALQRFVVTGSASLCGCSRLYFTSDRATADYAQFAIYVSERAR